MPARARAFRGGKDAQRRRGPKAGSNLITISARNVEWIIQRVRLGMSEVFKIYAF
jgi:hypothetical protein